MGRQHSAVLGTLGILMAACSSSGEGPPSAPTVEPPSIRVQGRVISSTDRVPVAGVILLLFERPPPGDQNAVFVASDTTAADGTYLILFEPRCDKSYILRPRLPYFAEFAGSQHDFGPDMCDSGDWRAHFVVTLGLP